MSQIAMPLPEASSFAAEDYILTESNQPAYDALMAWPNWPDYGFWLHGPAHSGKSHLAAIWGQHAGDNAQLIDPVPELTDDTAEALFHTLNDVKASGRHILLVSHETPRSIACPLPDLQSRLRALPTAELNAPDDDLLRAVWFKRFADRQLQVAPAVIDYLLARSERSFKAIHRQVEQLDRAALEQQRAITIPLIKSLLPDNAP